jgi:N-acetylglucosamine repressor
MRVDQSVINTINKRNVINIIREQGPINKSKVAHIAGLSIPTVMRLTDDLLDKKLIYEVGKGESTGGKKPLMLQFSPNSHYLIGVDIGTTNIKAIVMDMAATVLSKVVTPTNISEDPCEIISRIIDSIQRTVFNVGLPLEKYLGIGLGMPGLLDTNTGKVLFSPDFKWENVDLMSPIRASFGIPVYMMNVTRAMAVGEKWFGPAKSISNFMCINLGYGIGSAIIFNDQIYTGGSDSSGEFGHMTLEKNGPLCGCGNYGCLEALASANAMSKKAAFLIERGEHSMILSMAGGSARNIDAKIIFDAAKLGDNLAKEIVREAVDYIGIAIANVVNFIDPELIILEGGVSKAGDILLDGIKRVVERRQMKYAGRKLRVILSEFGDDAAAIGAASILISQLIENGGNLEKLESQKTG